MASKGSDAYLYDMLDMSESSNLEKQQSEIAKFFAYTNILVTGGTGFLGKLLIEKILRSCPDVATVYMIVRPKKGKNSQERFKENFNGIEFSRLRREQPNFVNKVIMLEGDAAQQDFGLSPESKKILMNTNIIFHAAATVRFDEIFRTAINTNVKNTKYMLLFAKELPYLMAFVHVSTAFSHCMLKSIDEIHYKVPIDGDKILTLLDVLDDDKLEKITPVIIDKWPNTYVFSKALGESIVLKYSNNLPVCIVRPSIMISTSEEPLSGWTNNLYGATGVVMGSSVGLLHTLHCVEEHVAEIIPADYIISNVICAAWDIANRKSSIKSNDSNISDEERIPIYNSVSSCQNPISWKEFMKWNEKYGFTVPSVNMVWYYMLIVTRYFIVYQLCSFFFHIVPAAIADMLAYLVGRKPQLLNVYKKIHKFSNVIHYFSTREWHFRNENVVKLWEKLNSVDQQTFKFNVACVTWHDYLYYHMRGIRLYMLNDPFETLDEAFKKIIKLFIAHYTLIMLVSLLLLWTFVRFITFAWSFCPLAH
ncbi:fatty acyl-CoA reductase wat-like [Colletes gigas]|uniref:fatty acyl-CoA reductase wat-like n=1 Tax=Colletes gigas TaxID=935657 RepID=UPI001C9B88FE|nr:fatty acyl-CoA reductase wat-like [Colletes gigas]